MAKISFYFDEMMPSATAKGLRDKGYEVVMAKEVGMRKKDDMTEHLPYATEHNLVLLTHDFPFAGRAAKIDTHSGVICWTGALDDFGGMIKALTKFAEENTAEDVNGRVCWIK